MKYQPTIGIETHVQLNTRSKLFCGCDNDSRQTKPNQNVCPICSGHPGTLPVLNKQAVMLSMRAGITLSGRINTQTKFDRKNYFYPDLPKGYQITQFDQPIVTGGHVKLPDGKKVGITRAHLEEDAGKLTHPENKDYSLVDLNRAGTPLLEIVSEPDIESAAQAKEYAKELHALMRYAQVSDADLYHGHMRFDVNVSIAPEGETLGTRTEIKNLNSFKAVEGAVAYEIERQTSLLEKGGQVTQETRGWDEAASKTYAQRGKEESHDYRYFPEPDVPPLILKQELIESVRAELPLLPADYRQRFGKLLSKSDLETLIEQPARMRLLSEVEANHALAANWLINDIDDLGGLAAAQLDQLAELVKLNQISPTAAKQILQRLQAEPGAEVEQTVDQLDLRQVSGQTELEKWAEGVIAANSKPVADFKSGQAGALQFLVGQVMKISKGKANPAMVSDILKQKLSEHND